MTRLADLETDPSSVLSQDTVEPGLWPIERRDISYDALDQGACRGSVNGDPIELSVVIPCLNEAETLGVCLQKARSALSGIAAEIIVADNGSTDESASIARDLGACVVSVPKRGYGSALMQGIAAARGKYVLMGDADDSYDFTEIPRFLERLRSGDELVQGCRLPSGGGTVAPGAMPFWHRWLGNPLLTMTARAMFDVPVHDIYCGMRGFTKELYERLEMRCVGMEFATEMIIQSTRQRARISEVPITLYPDGRIKNSSHLRTIRDGCRTLALFLHHYPRNQLLLHAAGVGAIALIAIAATSTEIFRSGLRPNEALLFLSGTLFGGMAMRMPGAGHARAGS